MSGQPIIDRLAVIGCGLIGGSIARAAKASEAAKTVVVTDASAEVRKRVREIGSDFANEVAETSAEAAKGADLIVVAVPVGACGQVAKEIGGSLKPGAILSDVGSVKASVARDMAPHIPNGVHFIPAHPVAGTENSGPDAGFAELFVNRWSILTPVEGTEPEAVEKLKAFWEKIGANVAIMTPDHHDL
ncbi:MAG: prephenate dehydrogenase/arogenate dehydrogenase family protein, partial [Pseudorhodoplanes sp.]